MLAYLPGDAPARIYALVHHATSKQGYAYCIKNDELYTLSAQLHYLEQAAFGALQRQITAPRLHRMHQIVTYRLSATQYTSINVIQNGVTRGKNVMSNILTPPARKTERINLRVEPQLARQFAELAEAHGLTPSELHRRAMLATLKSTQKDKRQS